MPQTMRGVLQDWGGVEQKGMVRRKYARLQVISARRQRKRSGKVGVPIFAQFTAGLINQRLECTHKEPKKKDSPVPVFTKKENAMLAQRIDILDWIPCKWFENQSQNGVRHFDAVYPNLQSQASSFQHMGKGRKEKVASRMGFRGAQTANG